MPKPARKMASFLVLLIDARRRGVPAPIGHLLE